MKIAGKDDLPYSGIAGRKRLRWSALTPSCTLVLLAASTFSAKAADFPPSVWLYYDQHIANSPHPFHGHCCNDKDCIFAKPGAVTWTPKGFKVTMPDGSHQYVQENDQRLRQYPKPFDQERRFGACFGKSFDGWRLRCLYMAGGAT